MELDLDNIEFHTALDLIQETNQSFFLTGKAGTGKSRYPKSATKVSLCLLLPLFISSFTLQCVDEFFHTLTIKPTRQTDRNDCLY
jgi:hypothetical protein